jgi:hypothetical protein
MPHRAVAQGSNDPFANVPKLLQVLDRDGFEAFQGQFRILDLVEALLGKLEFGPTLCTNLESDGMTPRILGNPQ